ncbi:Endoribonuclease L-PSP/chorismate mutase-like protein [Dendryphion nanum]|uniref:Endoribonuclease L-PSP/chorismate mutase-like protein n=1 Tax=Dendryphion nanum TaxID=256645 RepID=A0A9P9D081_9PLEO|nr:Endoribonuclease L-PSP/chorismate mutase-like protein [Dendryphion nanum]
MASSTKPHAFNPANVPTPPPTYSQVCVTPLLPTTKIVTLAGQVGIDPSNNELATTFIDQVKFAYQNVNNSLKAAGASPRDIAHVKHYIVKDTGDVELDGKDVVDRGWGKLWVEFMNHEAEGHLPPDTVLGVASLAKKDLLYEVEVLAIVNG